MYYNACISLQITGHSRRHGNWFMTSSWTRVNLWYSDLNVDFTFHGIPSKFFIANSNLKDERYGGEKTLYVSSIWPHTHEYNNNPVSIVHLFFQTMHVWHKFKNTPSIPKYLSFRDFNKWLHTEQSEWIYTLKYVYIHPYVPVHLKSLKD